MKDTKNVIIVCLSVLVVGLVVMLSFLMGEFAAQNDIRGEVSGRETVERTVDYEDDLAWEQDDNRVQQGQTSEDEDGTDSSTENSAGNNTQASDGDDSGNNNQAGTEDGNGNNTQEGTGEGGQHSGSAETSDVPAGSIRVSINTANTWGENPVNSQLDIVLENTADKDVEGWEVRINVGENAAVQSGWRCKYTLESGKLVLTAEEYNSVIPAGGSCDMGVIMYDVTGDLSYTSKALGIKEVTGAGQGHQSNGGSNQNNGGQGGQSGGQSQGQQGGNGSSGALDVPPPTTDDWLYVKGNKIVDSTGKQVWITGVNWFGYNTGSNIFDGLWNSDLNESIQGIANHGFNLIRVPMSAELILQWKNGQYPTANFNQATNHYLVNMNSLEIFDYVIDQCRANGLKIMIDIHSAKTDSMGHMANMWYNGNITTEKYQEALVWMAQRYAKDDTIIAYDLKNEPHGKPYETDKAIWNNSKSKNNWKYVAEQTALKILEKNPNVLIMVEGTEIYPRDIRRNGDYSSTNDADYYFNWWGGNLRGVADYPVDLGKYQNKLVYSPHDYGPTVHKQPWFFDGYDYESLYRDCWRDNWLYIYEEGEAPLLIGEWGGFMTQPNLAWMTHMRTLISDYKLHHTFWCFNANSGDTGGLVKDDFKTWDEQKYGFVKEVLWQQNGKFVGLDHEIPLGKAGNGIALSQAKGVK